MSSEVGLIKSACLFGRYTDLADTGNNVGSISLVFSEAFVLVSPDVLIKKNFHKMELRCMLNG